MTSVKLPRFLVNSSTRTSGVPLNFGWALFVWFFVLMHSPCRKWFFLLPLQEMIFSPLCNCRWLQTGLPLWTPAMGEVLLQGLSSKRYLLKKCRISWSSSHIWCNRNSCPVKTLSIWTILRSIMMRCWMTIGPGKPTMTRRSISKKISKQEDSVLFIEAIQQRLCCSSWDLLHSLSMYIHVLSLIVLCPCINLIIMYYWSEPV